MPIHDQWTDPSDLREKEYGDANNLNTRLGLYERFGTNPLGWPKWLFDKALEFVGPGEARVLDVGCGTASIWNKNSGRLPTAWTLVLSDLSLGILRHLKLTRLPLSPPGVVCSDVRFLPFATGTFDLVCAFNVLYHVDARDLAFEEVRRVLMPEGLFMASTVGSGHLLQLREILSSVVPGLGNLLVPSLFTLENAGSELCKYFPNVQVLRYRDGLEVTDPEYLLKYLWSTAACRTLSAETGHQVEERIRKVFQTSHRFHITSDSGVLLATA